MGLGTEILREGNQVRASKYHLIATACTAAYGVATAPMMAAISSPGLEEYQANSIAHPVIMAVPTRTIMVTACLSISRLSIQSHASDARSATQQSQPLSVVRRRSSVNYSPA